MEHNKWKCALVRSTFSINGNALYLFNQLTMSLTDILIIRIKKYVQTHVILSSWNDLIFVDDMYNVMDNYDQEICLCTFHLLPLNTDHFCHKWLSYRSAPALSNSLWTVHRHTDKLKLIRIPDTWGSSALR